ncbi:J domain-containing protein [Pararhizobium haloflavum]|uniref:J domain-containing protein n=1 Tax=Pararhizobium haloflavum TaxID=2037914 RepID=UPI000C17D456|nr:DnaJ family molecular chaperone [Pararhizobium haloflavum]
MSFLARIFELVGETASDAFSRIIEAIRTVFEGDPATRRKVAFSVAMIALSAKMAKADGIVSDAEVRAFRQIFAIPPEESENVARLYNLAKQDVAGFEFYASKLASLCGSGENNCLLLEDILDGLFHIAKADGAIHRSEMAFLEAIARIFRIDESHFEQIMARHVHIGGFDPYKVLGVSRDADFQDIKRRYRQAVAANHPDRLIARGVPQEFLAIATDRTARLNAAYEAIERDRIAA